MSSTALDIQEPQNREVVAPASESAAIFQIIERAARDPNVDLDKMERLMAMRERELNRHAEQAFNEAMKAAQAEMRAISADATNTQTRSKYATYAKLDAALRPIYTAPTLEAAETELLTFAESELGRKYPATVATWERAWERFIPFLAFPPEVRKIIYTTNAIEALHAKLRRAVRTRGHFPHDEAALKLLFLVLNRAAKEWRMPAREWHAARAQFAILFQDRLNP